MFATFQALGVDGKLHAAVQVLEKNGDCLIADRAVVCLDAPRVLRELGVNAEQLIVVSSQGGGDGVQERVENVIGILRSAGVRNVTMGGFNPGPDRPIPPNY